MKMKAMSFFLTLVMCMTLCTPAFAKEQSLILQENMIETKIEQEIQNQMDGIRETIYDQLKAQNALVMMEVYEQLIYPDVEMRVRAKYGQNVLAASSDIEYHYAPNGGMLEGLTPVPGFEPLEYIKVGFDKEDSDKFIDQYFDYTFRPSKVLSAILGVTPQLHLVGLGLLAVTGYFDEKAKQAVRDAGGYAMIYTTYSPEFDTESAVILGWEDHPYLWSYTKDTVEFKPF